MPKRGVTSSRSPALSSLNSTLKSIEQPPHGVELQARRRVRQVVGLLHEADLGERLPVRRGEGLADEARRVDDVGPQEVEGEGQALGDADVRPHRVLDLVLGRPWFRSRGGVAGEDTLPVPEVRGVEVG